MTRDPKLTFGPACPFTPWDQSQQKQLHANRCEGEMGTGEKKRPLLTRQVGTGGVQQPGSSHRGASESSGGPMAGLGGTKQTDLSDRQISSACKSQVTSIYRKIILLFIWLCRQQGSRVAHDTK